MHPSQQLLFATASAALDARGANADSDATSANTATADPTALPTCLPVHSITLSDRDRPPPDAAASTNGFGRSSIPVPHSRWVPTTRRLQSISVPLSMTTEAPIAVPETHEVTARKWPKTTHGPIKHTTPRASISRQARISAILPRSTCGRQPSTCRQASGSRTPRQTSRSRARSWAGTASATPPASWYRRGIHRPG